MVVSLISLTSLLSFHIPLTAEGDVSVLGMVGTVEDIVSDAVGGLWLLDEGATKGSTGRVNRGDGKGLL